MRISDAARAARKTGKEMYRTEWTERGTECRILPTNTSDCCQVRRKGEWPKIRWNPKLEDILAEDWVVDGEEYEASDPRGSVEEAARIAFENRFENKGVMRRMKQGFNMRIRPVMYSECLWPEREIEYIRYTGPRWAPTLEDLTARDWTAYD